MTWHTRIMTTIILGLASPVLGLAGVVLGIWYGQRHWKRERQDRVGDFYHAKRREAYTELWEVVQDAHLGMRASLTDGLSFDFSVFLTNVNSFAWKHGLYVEDDDRELAQAYLYLTYEFLRLVAQNEVAGSWIATTAAFPSDVPATLRRMKVAEDEANTARDRLIERIRAVIGGQPEKLSQRTRTDGEVLQAQFNDLLKRRLEPSPTPLGSHAESREGAELGPEPRQGHVHGDGV